MDTDDPTRRFSSRVADYVRARPGYPPAVLDWLADQTGLTPDWPVADVGAGPGNLSRLFLANGNAVVGIEPNREMREAGERLLADEPRYRSVDGRAEATMLPDASVDLVAAGQAFHWFDAEVARREFARVLRPPGWVTLVWNERRAGGTPFLAAYERLLLTHGTDYSAVRHQDVSGDAAIAAFFGPAGFAKATFPNAQRFDLAGLEGRLRSTSYAPQPGDPGHDAMVDELGRIFAAHQTDGRIDFPYDANVYVGRIAPR